jgi:hypothetical protein
LRADCVFPRFQGSLGRARTSRAWCEEQMIGFQSSKREAIVQAMKRYEGETGYRTAMADQYDDSKARGRAF